MDVMREALEPIEIDYINLPENFEYEEEIS
jgi:hypothetical protein